MSVKQSFMVLLVAATIVSCGKDAAGPSARPASLSLAAAAPQSAPAGTSINNLAVVVKDEAGNNLSGQPLTITASAGSTITGAPTSTTSGATSLGTWTLGSAVGPNTLTITSGSLGPLVITVNGIAGPPAAIAVQGSGQSARAGTAVATPIRVTVTDQFGNPVAGVQTTFSVSAGQGTLTGPSTVTTDASGNATAPTWTLGKRNIPQQLTVSAGGVTQTINATIQTAMRISLRFFGGISAPHRTVFEGAATRITAMIVNGAPPVQATNYDVAGICGVEGEPPLTELIDGIIIYASISPIDGPGGTLAQAGPCAFRSSATQFLPAIAVIQFDVDDLQFLTAGGSLEDVAMHEMMHSLGSGVLWRTFGILDGFNTNDPRYTGTWGLTGCRNLGGLVTCATDVPVENTGGPGTANSHWRETTFVNELMSGYLNAGSNPMSAMSVLSMQDIGYVANVAAADIYNVAAGIRTMSPAITTDPKWEKVITVESPDELEPHGGLLRPRLR